jgi:hypothetical protein
MISTTTLLAVLLLIAGLAYAQGPVPDPATNGVAWFDWLYSAAQSHDRMAVIAALLVAATALWRWVAPKIHGKLGEAVNGPVGKPISVLVLAELGAVGTALLGHHLDARTLLSGLVVAFFAAGGYSTFKPLVEKLFGSSGQAGKAATAILLLVGLGLSSSGCACFQKDSADYNTAKCVVARDTVDCTITAVESLGPVAWGIVESLLGQQASIDWSAVLAGLKQAGLRDGSCLLARIELWFASKLQAVQASPKPGQSFEAMRTQHEDFKQFYDEQMRAWGLAGVSFHFANAEVAAVPR